jgi:hypothetical protein
MRRGQNTEDEDERNDVEGVAFKAVREVGEGERSPEKWEVDRLREARLVSECEDRTWYREDVVSMLPPPIARRLAIFKRSKFRVSICVWEKFVWRDKGDCANKLDV